MLKSQCTLLWFNTYYHPHHCGHFCRKRKKGWTSSSSFRFFCSWEFLWCTMLLSSGHLSFFYSNNCWKIKNTSLKSNLFLSRLFDVDVHLPWFGYMKFVFNETILFSISVFSSLDNNKRYFSVTFWAHFLQKFKSIYKMVSLSEYSHLNLRNDAQNIWCS